MIIDPAHPGEYVADELAERGWTVDDLADRMPYRSWPGRTRLAEIVAGRGRISPSIAESLGYAFGTSWEVWIGLQRQYDKAHPPKSLPINEP